MTNRWTRRRLTFSTSERTHYLIDSAAPGSRTLEHERLEFAPGDYLVEIKAEGSADGIRELVGFRVTG